MNQPDPLTGLTDPPARKPGAVWALMLKLYGKLALVEIPENMICTDVLWPNRHSADDPAPVHAVAEAMRLARKYVETYIAACKESAPEYPR